ncbi:MAG: hypothetical protein N2381_11050, partial [Armatimonadetes bacterium]|nr:hypothetical protein [Armatimonadota bacterium]
DASSDDEYANRFYIPCFRRIGDFRTVLALISPSPLLLHNTHKNFPKNWAQTSYKIMGRQRDLVITEKNLSMDDIANWLAK